MRRRGRTAVAAGLAAFALSQLLLAAALEWPRPAWRDPEFGARWGHFRASAPDGRPLCVALGSSRLAMGLDPVSMQSGDRVLNFAQSGHRSAGMLANYARLRGRGVRPTRVILELLPSSLSDAQPPESTLDPAALGLAECGALAGVADSPARLWGRALARRSGPASAARANLLSCAGAGALLPPTVRADHWPKQIRPTGWMPYFFESVPPERRAENFRRAGAEYAGPLANFRVEAAPLRTLHALLDWLNADGVRVYWVLTPESPHFRALTPPATRGAVRAALDGLMARTPGAGLCDASDWFDAEEDFADGHHLLRHAAQVFSRRLGAEYGTWARGCSAD